MTSILEELWGKIQEYEKEHNLNKLKCSIKRHASPKRRSERIRQLLKSTINDSFSIGSSPLKCTDDLCPGPESMERENAVDDATVRLPGNANKDCAEPPDADPTTVNITLAEELECSGIDTSSSYHDESKKSNSSSSSDQSWTPGSSEREESDKSGCQSTDVSRNESKSDISISDNFQTPEPSTSQDEAYTTPPEHDSSTALGILNKISEELSCLNRDGASLATSRHDPKRAKSNKSRTTPAKTPTKIKFNFKTPTKSPRLISPSGSPGKGTLGKSPGRSPFKFGFKTPTRSKQRTPVNPNLPSRGGISVKRKVLSDSASPESKKL